MVGVGTRHDPDNMTTIRQPGRKGMHEPTDAVHGTRGVLPTHEDDVQPSSRGRSVG